MDKFLINLTQHTMTTEQVAELALHEIDVLDVKVNETIQSFITFNWLPSEDELVTRAEGVAGLAEELGATHALIGGAGYFMPYLECALKQRGIRPLHAFTLRYVVENVHNGQVVKTSVFRHKGFIGL